MYNLKEKGSHNVTLPSIYIVVFRSFALRSLVNPSLIPRLLSLAVSKAIKAREISLGMRLGKPTNTVLHGFHRSGYLRDSNPRRKQLRASNWLRKWHRM